MSAGAVKKKKGKVVIREDLCKECGFCIACCKQECLNASERVNEKGYRVAVAAEGEKCNGCGICALVCPEAAIEVYSE